MPRGKVNLSYISNESTRRVTFKKRRTGLMKKANELTVLCDVEACVIMFSPYSPDPDVWPSQLAAQHVISRFRDLSSPEQDRKMVDQRGYAQQAVEKMNEKLVKLRMENQHGEMTQVLYHCLAGLRGFGNLTMADLNSMSCLVGQNLREIDCRLELLPN